MSDRAASLISRTDAALRDLEDAEIERINQALDASYLRLEERLLTRYPQYTADAKPDLLGTQRGVLLTNELTTLLTLLNPEREREIEQRYQRLLQTASKEGTTLSAELLRLQGGEDFVRATATVPIEAIAYAARDAVKRLKKHDERFREEAAAIIVQGLVQGQGARRVATSLRQRLGVTKGSAERIARTEIISAQDSATRANYKANGIEFVQRIATQDERTCGLCAARAGKVYPVDQAPAVIHPNDRCYNLPWMPEWEESGQTDNSWVERHAQDVRRRAKAQGQEVNEGLGPFERAIGIALPPTIWSPQQGWIDKAVEARGQNHALALLVLALLLLRGRGAEQPGPGPIPIPIPIPIPQPPEDKDDNELLRALLVGAAIAGVAVGSYYLARARYRAGFKESARMARRMAEQIEALDLGDNDQITFVAGGFAGMQGRSGREYAPIFGELLDGHLMVPVDTPEFDRAVPITEDPLKHVATNYSTVVGTAVIDGRNMSAVRMAATAYAYYKKYGKLPNLIGYSGGGMVASEAHEILKELGVDARTVTLGTPWFGFTDLSPDEHMGLMGTGDVFSRLPVQNAFFLEDVDSHWLDRYTNSPLFQGAIQDFFGTRKRPEGGIVKRDPADDVLIDLYPQLQLLSEEEIKALPSAAAQKLLEARRSSAIVKAQPSAIQLEEARRELARIQRGIELAPIDLGEARLESLALLPAKELDKLPPAIRAQIEGFRARAALPESPPVAIELRRSRLELARLAEETGLDLGPIDLGEAVIEKLAGLPAAEVRELPGFLRRAIEGFQARGALRSSGEIVVAARAELQRVVQAIELGTVDFGEAILERLATLPASELEALPSQLRRQIAGIRERLALPSSGDIVLAARAELDRIAREIELAPLDLGEAVLESLSFLGDVELQSLPAAVQRQIEGYRNKLLSGRLDPKQLPGLPDLKALPGYEQLLALPGVQQQLKGLLRGELPRLALPPGREVVIDQRERTALERKAQRELFQQARSVERGLARLAEFRVKEKLARIARQDLPPGQKLAAYRNALFQELQAIATPVTELRAPGAANNEQLTSFEFGGIRWYTPELRSTSPSLDLIRKLAELGLPDELVKWTNNIYVSRQTNAAEDFWRKRLKLITGRIPATVNLEDGSITLYRGRGKVEDVLRQMAYLLAYEKFGQLDPPENSEYRRAMAEGRPITTYGFNSPAADFADSVAQFFLDPDRLIRFNPQRYNAIARMLRYRHPPKEFRNRPPEEPDTRSPEIIETLRTRNRELSEQTQAQRQEAEALATSQRRKGRVRDELERINVNALGAKAEGAFASIGVQEQAIASLAQEVADLESRASNLLNPFNSPYFSEVPPAIRSTTRKLKAVERELDALAKVAGNAAKVRQNILKVREVLSDLSTRRESLQVSTRGRQLAEAAEELKLQVERAEQELIALSRSAERSQALRELQRVRAAIRIQQGGVSVADLQQRAIAPRIDNLTQLADSLESLQRRIDGDRSRLAELQSRLNRLPTRLSELPEDFQAQYEAIRRTRQAQGRLPERVESYRNLKEQFFGNLTQRQQTTQELATGYQDQRRAAINNIAALAGDRLKRISDSVQILTNLRQTSVAWLFERRKWETDPIPADLAALVSRQPGRTPQERLESAVKFVNRLLGQVGGSIKVLEEQLELPNREAQSRLEQIAQLRREWQGIRDALTEESPLSDRQVKALLKQPENIKAIDVIRYANQLQTDLARFNEDFVRILLSDDRTDPELIISQSEIYRRGRERFAADLADTRGAIAAEIEAALTTLNELEQRIRRDLEQPLVYDVNGRALTPEQIRAELQQTVEMLREMVRFQSVEGQVQVTEDEVIRQARRQQEFAQSAQRRQRLEALRAELAEVNREIQKRLEAAERGQKRGIATDRLEAKQRRILRDIEKLAREYERTDNGES